MNKCLLTLAHIAAAVGLGVPSLAGAEPITNFSLFGGNNTTLGTNVIVNSGLVGSNAWNDARGWF